MAATTLLARRKPAVLDAFYYGGLEDKVELLAWLKARRKAGYGIQDRVDKVLLDTPNHGRIIIQSTWWVLHIGRGAFQVLTQREYDDQYDTIGVSE